MPRTRDKPFFRKYANAAAIAAGAKTAPVIGETEVERFGPFQYFLAQNNSTEHLRVFFDGDSDEKSIQLRAGERIELIGTLIYDNYKLKNLDGSAEMAIDEIETYAGNLLPQEQVQVRSVKRARDGSVVI